MGTPTETGRAAITHRATAHWLPHTKLNFGSMSAYVGQLWSV